MTIVKSETIYCEICVLGLVQHWPPTSTTCDSKNLILNRMRLQHLQVYTTLTSLENQKKFYLFFLDYSRCEMLCTVKHEMLCTVKSAMQN